MLTDILYHFQFQEVSANAQKCGIIASFSLEVSIQGCCVLQASNWTARSGKNGTFPVPPQIEYGDGEGKKYRKAFYLWPKVKESTNAEEYRAFQEEFKKAYAAWKGSQDGPPGDIPRPPERGPQLPPGWKKRWDGQVKMNYFVTPDGRSLWEDDDEVKRALADEASFPPPPPRRAA